MSNLQLVVAGNQQQYESWMRFKNNHTLDYKYIYKAEQIYAYKDIVIYFIGSYWENDDYHAIKEYCEFHNFGIFYL